MKVHCYIVVRFEGGIMTQIVMVYREYDKAKVFCDALNAKAREDEEKFPMHFNDNSAYVYRIIDREIL